MKSRSRSFNAQLILVIIAVIALCWTAVFGVVVTQFSLNRSSTWDEKLQAIATQLPAPFGVGSVATQFGIGQ